MKYYAEIRTQILDAVKCDVCCAKYHDKLEDKEFGEMILIKFKGGYGSVFGDGATVEIDICQKCFKEKLGEWIRVRVDEYER